MALEAGELTLLLEYGSELKDVEWFGKQDPFCTITVGSQTYRSKTATDGGRSPVFNETFKFNVINENDFTITVKDKDVMSGDDYIGTGRGQLAKVRTYGHDKQQVPMMSKKGKQHGFIQVSLTFTRNSSIGAPGHGAPMPYGAPQYGAPMPYGAPQYGAPPPYGYGAPAPGPYGYGAPPPGQYGAPPPGQYGAPPPGQYGAPPPGQYGAPPPGQYPPQHGYPHQQHGAPPPGHYPPQGYPPAGGHGGHAH